MGFLLQDARFGARLFLRTPILTGSIVLLLALGIGANSAMFSVVDGLLLHPVRYQDPDKLVFVWSHDPQGGLSDISPADYMDVRARSSSLSGLAAWMPTTFVVLGGERPRQLGGARVTTNFFQTLGVKPVLGRTFLADEDGLDKAANASRSVVISYRFWQQDLGGDPNVLGRILRIDLIPYTVIGVAPADFRFWWRAHDLWIPVTLNIHERDYRDLVVIGRLTDTRARAATELNVTAKSLADTYPKNDRGWTLQIENLDERLLNQTFRSRLLLLSGAVGLVLLLACANISSLLLASAAARQREIAVRVSLGASRRRLAQQLITESALLALTGGALGFVLAWALIRAAPGFVPANAIPGGPLELSWPVAWFCLGLSLVTCLLVGLAPALGVLRSGTQAALKQSGRGTTAGRASQRTRQTIVAAEVASALILLAGAWLMTSSLRALMNADPGFDPSGVVTVLLYLPPAKYNAAQALEFYRMGLEGMARLPGVESASVGTALPLLTNTVANFDREGSARDVAEWPSVPYSAVGVDYFKMLRIPLISGRLFTEADDERSKLVAIVSKAFADRYFPGEDLLGKRIAVSRPARFQSTEELVTVEIAGVVGNVKVIDLAGDTKPMIYVPHRQNPFSRGVWFAARVARTPAAFSSAIRGVFQSIDREQPVEQVGSLEENLEKQLAPTRFQTGLMSSFAFIALFLAALGIYGVNAYSVAQRQNEIGLRMALGATQGAVLRQVILRGMLPTGIGIVVGILGAAATTSLLRSVLVGTGALDPLAFLGAALVLAAAAALACYFPARRATRIDPAIILRLE